MVLFDEIISIAGYKHLYLYLGFTLGHMTPQKSVIKENKRMSVISLMEGRSLNGKGFEGTLSQPFLIN